jgi:hypothetical protein
MTVTEIVAKRVANVTTDTELIDLSVKEVEQEIKNYCQIDKVPKELNFTWANMAVDLLRYQHAASGTAAEAESFNLGDVSSLKIGDTSVNLGAGSATNAHNIAIKSHNPNLDDIVLNYRQQLNKFRRMVW